MSDRKWNDKPIKASESAITNPLTNTTTWVCFWTDDCLAPCSFPHYKPSTLLFGVAGAQDAIARNNRLNIIPTWTWHFRLFRWACVVLCHKFALQVWFHLQSQFEQEPYETCCQDSSHPDKSHRWPCEDKDHHHAKKLQDDPRCGAVVFSLRDCWC